MQQCSRKCSSSRMEEKECFSPGIGPEPISIQLYITITIHYSVGYNTNLSPIYVLCL